MGITLLKLLTTPYFLQTKYESTQGFKPVNAYNLKFLENRSFMFFNLKVPTTCFFEWKDLCKHKNIFFLKHIAQFV
jgi:hypothetical protein